MIRCEELHKGFRPPVLRGITFEVPAGEGKTTTLRILTGLLEADTGHATVGGSPAGSRHAKHLMGYVPEQPTVYETLTPREYFLVIGALHGLDNTVVHRRGDAIMQRNNAVATALSLRAQEAQRTTRRDERAALLARQAYLIGRRGDGSAIPAADEALRSVLSVPY